MEPPARCYSCAQCQTRVLVCSRCDRGNRYCKDCARQVRKCKQHEAARRYQNSGRGRRNHAQRQRRYRARQRRLSEPLAEKVTHQGSPPPSPAALLPSETTALQSPQSQPLQASKSLWRCHFCQCECPEFVRIDFLRCRIRRPTRLPDQKGSTHDRDP